MTAEIAVMNKSAIALAADSAVTASRKIYNSVNKLFSLSKYHPVGIMIYNNSDLTGVPWETIIKAYRSHLGEKCFDTIKDYAEDFKAFILDNPCITNDQTEQYYFRSRVTNYFFSIKERINQGVETYLSERETLEGIDLRTVFDEVFDKIVRKELEAQEKLESFLNMQDAIEHVESLVQDQDGEQNIENWIGGIFSDCPVQPSEERASVLKQLAVSLFHKQSFDHTLFSGVVIAGFGEKDIFPKIVSLKVEGAIGGCLKHEWEDESAITLDNAAVIRPFAQSDTIHSFVRGVDNDLISTIMSCVSKILKGFPNAIQERVDLPTEHYELISKETPILCEDMINEFANFVGNYLQTKHVGPILEAVAVLPKDELSAMAESLINVICLKRRVSMGSAETVGGPVDVAIISKGDGFVWVKRKHYFEQSLNHQFFSTYFRTIRGGESDGCND